MNNTINFPAIQWPPNLTKLLGLTGSKISLSRIQDPVTFFDERYTWMISVYIMADICRVCGIVVGNVKQHPNLKPCLRHSWKRKVMLALFHTAGEDADWQSAVDKAEAKAADYLANPQNWQNWEIEGFLSVSEYLAAQRY